MIDYRLMLPFALAACGPAAEERGAPPPQSGAAEPKEAAAVPAGKRTMSGWESAFTKLDDANCRLVEENKEEGPYWLRRCSGLGGWALDWSESDLRQGLDLIAPNSRKTELPLSSRVAHGAFNRLGSTIEWRGRDLAKPEALIVRMAVANGAEPEKPDISKLAVVKLTGMPCLVAIIDPGPDQNQKARDVADGPMAACLAD